MSEITEATEPMYCVRGDCHRIATHIVSTYDKVTDGLVASYAMCRWDAPSVLMGHSDRVRARFVVIDPTATVEVA